LTVERSTDGRRRPTTRESALESTNARERTKRKSTRVVDDRQRVASRRPRANDASMDAQDAARTRARLGERRRRRSARRRGTNARANVRARA
jgi:hypothetical protein